MAIFKTIRIKFLTPNIKILLPPILFIFILVMLFGVLLRTGYPRVMKQINEIREIEKDINILENKVNVLREITGNVLGYTEKTAIALPAKNPGALTLSQVNKAASDNSLLIKDVKLVKPLLVEDIASIELLVELTAKDADIASIIRFMQLIDEFAPVVSAKEIKVGKTAEERTVSLTLRVFWSKFPTEIPPLSQPIKSFTQSEQEILAQVFSLQTPELGTLVPEQPLLRETPFN